MRDVDVLVNQMQVMTQQWKEDMARSEAREERLIASILRTDSMVEKLMQRMDNIQPQPNTFSPPPQHQPPQDAYYGYGCLTYLHYRLKSTLPFIQHNFYTLPQCVYIYIHTQSEFIYINICFFVTFKVLPFILVCFYTLFYFS